MKQEVFISAVIRLISVLSATSSKLHNLGQLVSVPSDLSKSLLSQKKDILWPQKAVTQAYSLFKNDATAQ